MNLPSLYIFSKNTDAYASARGYNYQSMKTVEKWLYNYLNEIDIEIYCDYEEDIFQKNLLDQSIIFSQIKLYSSNFSFKSEEIKKCLAHFFMLYVKADYQDINEIEFVFETNAFIKKDYRGNDADLLKEWVINQKNLSGNILDLCISKVKSIVSEYIKEQIPKVSKKHSSSVIEKALSTYINLSKKQWEKFIKQIKWVFSDIPPEDSFKQVMANIEKYLFRLPLGYNQDKVQILIGVLYKEVSLKISEKEPRNRKLTISDLEDNLIGLKSKDDSWYLDIYRKWRYVSNFNCCRIGQLMEILSAISFFKYKKYLKRHNDIWLNILKIYIDGGILDEKFRLKVIYEYLWLKLDLDLESKAINGNLLEYDSLINFYFSDFACFSNPSALESASSFLSIISSATQAKKTNIALEQIDLWYSELVASINNKLDITNDPNDICHLNELLSTIIIYSPISDCTTQANLELLKKCYLNILDLINDAPYYNVTLLSGSINEYLKILLSKKDNIYCETIDILEEFSSKLDPWVRNRHGEQEGARIKTERGINFLDSENSRYILKALSCFHEARALGAKKETIKGYVGVMLNISQVYSVMRLNFAAKYYAFSALWVSLRYEELYSEIPITFGHLFSCDFRQGGWFNAMMNFHFYIKYLYKFIPEGLDFEKDSMITKIIADYSLILYSCSRLTEGKKELVDRQIQLLSPDIKELVSTSFNILDKCVDKLPLNSIIDGKLDDYPFNDGGGIRIVSFKGLGITWRIEFENNYYMSSVGEEFCAFLQILLAEIASSNFDFHLVKVNVDLLLEFSDNFKDPRQIPSQKSYRWNVFVQKLNSTKRKNITNQAAQVATVLYSILDEVSLLKKDEFYIEFEKLLNNANLFEKIITVNSYQRMYRKYYMKEDFDVEIRQDNPMFKVNGEFPKEDIALKWNDKLSFKYNKAKSIQKIKERFKNSIRSTHLTIENLKMNSQFIANINVLRAKGFLDWQIVLGIVNFMISHKAKMKVKFENLSFTDETEYIAKVYEYEKQFIAIDERLFYIVYPAEAFESEEFLLRLDTLAINVLRSFDLECKLRYPNIVAIKEFLDKKFNMNVDDTDEGNFIKDIK